MRTDERDWADRFSRDVDGLLNEAGRTDSEPRPTEYRQALDLARTLATTDFSAESRMRQALRRRLLNRIGTREGWYRQKEYIMRTFFRKLRLVVALASAVLAAFLVVALAWPDALTAMAQSIRDFVQILSVGEHTTVYQVDPDSAASRPQWTPSARPRVELRWTIRTPIGDYSNHAAFGQDPTVHYCSTFDEAQTITPFRLRQPDYIPEDYAFLDAMVPPPPANEAFLFYKSPDDKIVLIEMPVYTRVEVIDETTMTVAGVWFGLTTEEPVEEVTLNGQRAAWVEGYGLVWEAEDIICILGGPDLSLEEAIRIAKSLE